MTLELKDPTRRELREAFEVFDALGEILVSRWYPRARLYNWIYRYGWTASVKQEGEFWRVTRTGGNGRAVGENAPVQAQIRQRLDVLPVGGAFDATGFTEHQALAAARSFPGKRFRLQPVEDGSTLIIRMDDPE